ncbi:hypothetical protein FHT44_004069 [Mycolicibacterium sp. BK634]|uniref:hypothetical protein n=1 Tax=Mycolicibacterium sp. BK634 TaxID=2587099 RepID=UPI00160C7C23|nr:hypothetical protein [Mycolicibacterium sp. BK634]MBB3751574.1 hypothetical protein [Mycolicibacterium sp. BK634]
MTTLSPPPIRENILQFAEAEPEPPSRWRRFIPRSRRAKAAVAGGLSVLLVAGVLTATYETSPGGTLWGAEKMIFPEHSQDVALAAVVSDLKQAQDILGGGQQPTPDQLTAARTSLNQAKQDLDYLSASPQRTSLQNLYLQLTQQLLQYTPESVQQLPPLPLPPPPDPSQAPDVALTSASAPSWGYPITDESATLAPPPGVPDAPLADWPQPYAPPLTPNLGDLGYYDPSWGQLYGYDPGDWYNYDLSGYNQYGYDFLGFDRWGYDRWGYDRWGYDHWGYNWAGYNWAGYDRDGWDRDGRNDWGQRRDHPGDPRNQDWYNDHHAYQQYYQWKFQNNDPVYHRTQWDQAHGFNANLYQNWNRNRDWHNPRNRDWAPPAAAAVTNIDVHASSPVVNLNASLTQFISTDKATNSGQLLKDLANKPAREFTNELNPRITMSTGLQPQPLSTLGKLPPGNRQTALAPPILTAPAPATPPSKVSPGFAAPKLSPVPAYTPPKADQPPGSREPGRDAMPPSGAVAIPPKADPQPAAPPAPREVNPAEQAPDPVPHRQAQEQPPAQDAPAPRAPSPAPKAEAPARPAPEPQAPVRQAPAPRAHEAPPQQPTRQAPPQHEAPAPRPAPEQHSAPAPSGPKCSMPGMCG